MVTLRKRRREEITASPKRTEDRNPSKKPKNNANKRSEETVVKNYEQSRDERIKENLLRMQKLGIHDLSQKLKSHFVSPPKLAQKKTQQPKSPPLTLEPPRRSSRLQNVTPVSYVDVRPKKAQNLTAQEEISLKAGRIPEIYTEEHHKLLGACKNSWELFKDGYGEDGRRIYDSIYGKTCHQCRQKTLGHRTHCRTCNLVQGQFCGDCLYMRYGENVLEVKDNPNWICPVCRGICNCSLCRLKKGWLPTGSLYRRVSSLGFKSVAHYLIQTRRSVPNAEDLVPNLPPSAKRSLPFTDTEDMKVDSNGWDEEVNNVASEREELKKQLEAKVRIKHKAMKPSLKSRNKHKMMNPTAIPQLRQEGATVSGSSESKMREKRIARKPTVILPPSPESGSDVASESKLKSTTVLLLSPDGVVHFVSLSDPKATAIPRLSLDGLLHFACENELKPTALGSEPKPTAAPEPNSDGVLHFALQSDEPKPTAAPALSSNGVSNGVLGAEPSVVALESDSKPTALGNEPKPTGAPEPSSDGVLHFALRSNKPKPTAAPALSSNCVSNGVLGTEPSVVSLESDVKPTTVQDLSSDGVLRVAAQMELKPTADPKLSSDGAHYGALGNKSIIRTKQKPGKAPVVSNLSPDSIAGRLRMRHNKS